MTCRPHHAACPQGEACTCERTSPDDPYRMHGTGHEPEEDDSHTRDTADAMSSEAEQCAEAIRALEVQP